MQVQLTKTNKDVAQQDTKVWDTERLQTTTRHQQDNNASKQQHRRIWDPGGLQ
jgi:hypothetical protein